MRVVVLPEVRTYLYELSDILYQNEYFGFLDSAKEYVETLFEEIKTTLPYRQKKLAPPYFNKYGKLLFYSTFQKNKRTTWYVFFNLYEENGDFTFLVRYISNNHVVAKYF